ncbi:MAG: hypothetical protein IV086_00240 [Hyphomonadaceae bacterium]|nr:hypothetical protein [Hyphomonadaceae bacterium]
MGAVRRGTRKSRAALDLQQDFFAVNDADCGDIPEPMTTTRAEVFDTRLAAALNERDARGEQGVGLARPPLRCARGLPLAVSLSVGPAASEGVGMPAGQLGVTETALAAALVAVGQSRPSTSHRVATKRTEIEGTARRIRAEDLPPYDQDDVALVDASLAELSSSKVWFTYVDIQRCFGVSRATVARKLKAGLVPGIRFQGDRVVEEGAVRRFSRTQVRFVLLAVRRRDWRSGVF